MSDWNCDRIEMPTDGIRPINITVSCYEEASTEMYYITIEDIKDTVSTNIIGTVEDKHGTKQSDQIVPIDIDFVSVDNYNCRNEKVPKIIYDLRDDYKHLENGPVVPAGYECVSPVRLDENECNAQIENLNYNRDCDECQKKNVPDPFFMKNVPLEEI